MRTVFRAAGVDALGWVSPQLHAAGTSPGSIRAPAADLCFRHRHSPAQVQEPGLRTTPAKPLAPTSELRSPTSEPRPQHQ
uniref:hypothetical protein n=1 Tax=Pseudoclavibacter sp. RFBI5 TaxID=2080578 RepID=UPI001CA54515